MDRTLYGCIEVPFVTVSLIKNGSIVYTFENDSAIVYDYLYGTDKDCLYVSFTLMNPEDYKMLTTAIYDKYVVESRTNWRNSSTYEDELISAPKHVFKHFSIYKKLTVAGDPSEWKLEFWND